MRDSPKFASVALACVVLMAGCGSGEGDAGAQAEVVANAAVGAEAGLELANLRRTLELARDKFSQLAVAMPEGDYAWATMDGVRSVGAVFQHVVADNYFVPSLMGMTAPEGAGVTNDVETFRAFQAQSLSKAEIVAHVEASFAFMIESMDATAAELDRAMMLGQSETTVGDVWIRAVVHLHEHLGQSIAYSRSNGVVPPWSMP